MNDANTPLLEMNVSLTRENFGLAASFQLNEPSIVALFGKSGSGKTTALRIIAGLERASGTLSFKGLSWQKDNDCLPAHLRPVGYIIQKPSLFPHLSVTDNLKFGQKRSKNSALLSFDDAVSICGIEDLLHRRPENLSGGEAQRVSIARALLSNPELLLFDEPVSALDRSAKWPILDRIKKISQSFNIPVIYVSHDIEEVSRIADYVIPIENGKTGHITPLSQAFGTSEFTSLLSRTETGSIINATVLEHDLDYHLSILRVGTQSLLLPKIDAVPAGDVRLRIKAKDVSISLDIIPSISIQNQLKTHITHISHDKKSAFAEVILECEGQELRVRITRKAADQLGLKIGADVFALIKSISFDQGV